MVELQIFDQQAGDIRLELAPLQALEKLSEFSDEKKWLFVDGQARNFSTLTQSDMESASVVQVTEQLQEG